METKHTPGPWAVQQQDPYAPIFILGPEPENRFIARLGWGFDHGDSSTKQDRQREIEDAKLIAAAPELLVALEAIKARLLNDREAFDSYGFQSCDDKEDDIMDVVMCTLRKATE